MSDVLFRLIGDGDRASGGAIPLPLALTAVTSELLDHGSADFRRLNTIVSDVMAFKEDRIMAAAWRSWPQFTRDILACLSDEMHLIKENQFQRWEITEELVPEYTYFIPGTTIGFTPRTKESRLRREANELVYLQLKRDIPVLQEGIIATLAKANDNLDPLAKVQLDQAIKLILETEKILTRELKLDEPVHQETYYRKTHPRPPHQRGKKLRTGMSGFFREFWTHAEQGKWYDMVDVAAKFNELHPDQPPLSHGDAHGSMRRIARNMEAEGVLESQRVLGNGAWKNEFRLKNTERNHYPGTIVEVHRVPAVTRDGIKKGPKE